MFKPIISNLSLLVDYEFQIHDRWGTVLFQSTQADEAWNGQSSNDYLYYAADGSYIWNLKIRFLNDTELKQYRGAVLMIR